MRTLVVGLLALVAFAVIGLPTAYAAVPGSMEITCDVDRRSFRSVARNETQVTFRLWDSEMGGNQCGTDHVLPMSALVGLKSFTDRFDSLLKRKALRLQAVIGSDATPVQLCGGAETWLDVQAGLQTFSCDFSAQSPQARRRLQSVPFAQVPGGASRVVSFTRDTSFASGQQVITGVGFTPRTLICFANQDTTAEISVGMYDGTTYFVMYDDSASNPDTYANRPTEVVFDHESVGNQYRGTLSSFDPDGFTVSWTKVGSPTGTLAVSCAAFR